MSDIKTYKMKIVCSNNVWNFKIYDDGGSSIARGAGYTSEREAVEAYEIWKSEQPEIGVGSSSGSIAQGEGSISSVAGNIPPAETVEKTDLTGDENKDDSQVENTVAPKVADEEVGSGSVGSATGNDLQGENVSDTKVENVTNSQGSNS